MISSEIINLLLNKYVLGSLSVLIALVYAYFKGSKAAKEAAAFALQEAERARQARVRAAEAKNAFLEKQGERKNEAINDATTIDQLLGLLNEGEPGKGPRPDADKNPK